MYTILGVLLLTGCAAGPEVQELRKTVAELREQVAITNKALAELRNQQDMAKLDAIFKSMDVAYLTPGSDGYSVVQMDLGRITVSLENIEAYANGSRVILSFGNPLAATINGAKAKLEWGSMDASGSPDNNNAKSKDVGVTQSLRPGGWTKVAFVLEGTPPASLGFVRLKNITHQGISLAQR